MRPLEGIRIVEAAQMISAPFAASLLSDQGADVVKVELANDVGDRMRYLGDQRNELGSVFAMCNRGKRSISLDTKKAEGVAAMQRLIGSADVFLQNFRPGAVDRMGIGPAEMMEANPRLIYVSVSGFGNDGPYADQMVYDYVIQGISGMAFVEGAGGDPVLAKNLVIDKATALTVAQAITAALFVRERTGSGQLIEINMLDAGLQFLWPDGMWNDTLIGDDVVRTPPMGHNYSPRKTSDGWVTLNLAANTTWPKLANAIDPALLDDPRFETYSLRMENSEVLADVVDGLLSKLDTEAVLAMMREHDLPGGPVVPLDRVHLDPQVAHNGSIIEHDAGAIGRVREPRPAARFGGTQSDPAGGAPLLGQHSDEVLAEIGYSADEVAELRTAGVIA